MVYMSRFLIAGAMGFSLVFSALIAQDQLFTVQPFAQIQLWSAYSVGQQVYDAEKQQYEAVDNRWNLQIRRGRMGLKGKAYKRLSYNFTLAYDFIGRDVLAAPVGGTNPNNPSLFIWQAFAQYQLCKGKEWAYLTAGFFPPQLGRESMTSAFATTSLEKTITQRYVRRHLVGSGPGRAMGLNIGGLMLQGDKFGLNYNLGLFSPNTTEPKSSNTFGNSAGNEYHPLLLGRVVLYLGDPEQTQYKTSYKINYFGKRKGLSIGLGASHQGNTELFEYSQDLAIDLLAHYGAFNLDGEWHWMQRGGTEGGGTTQQYFSYLSQTGHIRASVNLPLKKERTYLEPVASVAHFGGATDATGQAHARQVGSFSGAETSFDAGVNWYMSNNKIKIALHYTWGEGDHGATGPGSTPNEFFNQPGLGPIRRGDWLGLGVDVLL